MRNSVAAALILVQAALAGCASVPTVRIDDVAVPRSHEITDVAFFPQEDYQCGPASLAEVLSHAGVDVQPEQLVSEVFLPERKGSLQIEMVAAARRHERIPYVLERNRETVIREIAAGHPVLVLQNLGLGWLPVWHYAVVVGYDLDRQEFVLRSGRESRLATEFSVFERTWQRADHWAMVSLAPDRLPATAVEQNFLITVAAVERLGKPGVAARAYMAALEKWPESIGARFGLANASYASGNLAAAEENYREILRADADNAAVWNNLAQVLADQHRWTEAETAAQTAVGLGGDVAPTSRQTLMEIQRNAAQASSPQASP